MVDGLNIEDREGIRWLTLANPPSNALSPPLRAALVAALHATPPDCQAIVLRATGPTFSSALAIEPDHGAPRLAALCAAVEGAPVPVIAALQGLVMGPGAELALSARWRIAAPGTRIAFPDVVLGLCPEGGTTLRLPRLIGAEAALQLLLSGRALGADDALTLGLVDQIAAHPLEALPTRLDDRPRPASAQPMATAAAVAAARRGHPQPLPAVSRIIACVEAASLLPPEAHQAFEAVAREDLEATPEAAALRAAARAERRAACLPPGLARQRPVVPDQVALHGSGADLVALARLALTRGLTVGWTDLTEADRTSLLAALTPAQAARLTPGPTGAAALRIRTGSATPETPAAATLVLGGADGHLGLAMGPKGTGAELSVPPDGRTDSVALALATLRQIGLTPVLVGYRPVVAQRVLAAGTAALAALSQSGVPARALGAALTEFGPGLPPRAPSPDGPLRDLPPEEIRQRWLSAMANEGMRLLDQGIALRPSDIDLILMLAHGFPRWHCGPMHLADQRGLMLLRRDLRQWAGEDPLWQPAALLDRLIGEGLRLSDLDAA